MAGTITDIKGVAGQTAETLTENGFDSVETIAQASVEALCAVPGFGPARAQLVIDNARSLLDGIGDEDKQPVVRQAPVEEPEIVATDNEEKPAPDREPESEEVRPAGKSFSRKKKKKNGKQEKKREKKARMKNKKDKKKKKKRKKNK